MAPFDADPRWLGDAAWTIDASSGAEPPYAPHTPPVDTSTFKDVLARLASGVAIISCWDGRTPRGLLVSSITGLSVDPPRFLFCVRKEASSHDALLRADACGVAILSTEDEDEAQRFASPARAIERFTAGRWDLARPEAPWLRGGLASSLCDVDTVIDAGGHSIVLVTARHCLSRPGAPLVAFDRTLAAVAPLPAA
ncbi:MAG: flavin reductase [Caulobacter sp.]|nr:flavin reductase [Caulobacter sp.]